LKVAVPSATCHRRPGDWSFGLRTGVGPVRIVPTSGSPCPKVEASRAKCSINRAAVCGGLDFGGVGSGGPGFGGACVGSSARTDGAFGDARPAARPTSHATRVRAQRDPGRPCMPFSLRAAAVRPATTDVSVVHSRATSSSMLLVVSTT